MPEADPPEPASSEAAPEPRTVIIGVISAPGTSTELAERLRPDLTARIGAGYRAYAGWFGSFPIDLSTGQRIFPSSSPRPAGG